VCRSLPCAYDLAHRQMLELYPCSILKLSDDLWHVINKKAVEKPSRVPLWRAKARQRVWHVMTPDIRTNMAT
jgi:hypothetical protein